MSDLHTTERIARDPRVDSIEQRVGRIEVARVELAAQTATLSEGQRMMQEDVRELIREMRNTTESINSMNDRVDKISHDVMMDVDKKFSQIGKGFWAVVVLLVPVAVSLILGLVLAN